MKEIREMPLYTDKEMTVKEFHDLLRDRLLKGLSIDDYSYSSSNQTKISIKVDKNEESK